jgi:hypothetical protein
VKSFPPGTQPDASNAGLCADCVHARTITSDRGSHFVLCQLSFSDPKFPKYPRLPVLTCDGYKSQASSSGSD